MQKFTNAHLVHWDLQAEIFSIAFPCYFVCICEGNEIAFNFSLIPGPSQRLFQPLHHYLYQEYDNIYYCLYVTCINIAVRIYLGPISRKYMAMLGDFMQKAV